MLVGTCNVLWRNTLTMLVGLCPLRLMLDNVRLTCVASSMLPSCGLIMLARCLFLAAVRNRWFPCLMSPECMSPLTALVWAVGALTLLERDLLLLSVVPRPPLLMHWSVRLTVVSSAVLANGPGGWALFLLIAIPLIG